MKKLFVLMVLTMTATLGFGQKSIDDLFERYAGKDGFTTVTINGNLLKLFHGFSDDSVDAELPATINEIRILAQEDKNLHVDNFYNLVINDIDLKNYDEFMRVKNSNENLRMLVRSEGNRFREFLLIAGGEDNAVIQVKGNMTYEDARKFSKEAEKDHGMHIIKEHKE